MSISIKQLETLAKHFHFDMNEAREVIGIQLKKSTTAKSDKNESKLEKVNKTKNTSNQFNGFYQSDAEKKKPDGEKKKPDGEKKKPDGEKKKPDREKKQRGPSGYNLFVREQGISFKNAGASWKALSDVDRDRWNAKAHRGVGPSLEEGKVIVIR